MSGNWNWSQKPVTADELIVVGGELDQRPEYEFVLEMAVEGHDIPRPVESARGYVEDCRMMWRD